MAKTKKEKGRAIESDVTNFISEFARYLVAVGITWPRFSVLARLAFFNAALGQARFGNDRLNQSALSMITGLTRLQVRHFARQSNPEPPKPRDRLDRIIEGWASDPTFTKPDHSPMRLPISGRGKTFSALARRYGGDVPPRSILRELQRHGLVTLRNGEVSLKREAARSSAEIRLRVIAKALEELVSASGGQAIHQVPIQTLNLEVTFPATSRKGRLILKERASSDLRAYLMGLKAAGMAISNDLPPESKNGSRITRARVLLVTEDVEQ